MAETHHVTKYKYMQWMKHGDHPGIQVHHTEIDGEKPFGVAHSVPVYEPGDNLVMAKNWIGFNEANEVKVILSDLRYQHLLKRGLLP